jgi:hypothetical protein
MGKPKTGSTFGVDPESRMRPSAPEVPNRRDALVRGARARVDDRPPEAVDIMSIELGGSGALTPPLEPGQGPVPAVQSRSWPL